MPCRPSWSRSAYSRGMLGSSAFRTTALPLTVNLMVVVNVHSIKLSYLWCAQTRVPRAPTFLVVRRLVEYLRNRYAISAGSDVDRLFSRLQIVQQGGYPIEMPPHQVWSRFRLS